MEIKVDAEGDVNNIPPGSNVATGDISIDKGFFGGINGRDVVWFIAFLSLLILIIILIMFEVNNHSMQKSILKDQARIKTADDIKKHIDQKHFEYQHYESDMDQEAKSRSGNITQKQQNKQHINTSKDVYLTNYIVEELATKNKFCGLKDYAIHSNSSILVFDQNQHLVIFNNRFGGLTGAKKSDLLDINTVVNWSRKNVRNVDEIKKIVIETYETGLDQKFLIDRDDEEKPFKAIVIAISEGMGIEGVILKIDRS